MNIANEVKELRLLFEISRLFDGSSEVRARLDEVLALMGRHTGMARGSAALLEADGRGISVFSFAASRSEEFSRSDCRLGEDLIGRIIESGRPMALPKCSDEPFFLQPGGARDVSKEGLAFLGVPVTIGSSAIGALSADRLFADSVSLDEDLRLLGVLAALIAQAAQVRREFSEKAGKAGEAGKAKKTGLIETAPKAATLPEALDTLEKRLITEALSGHQGNMGKAAQALGISERIMGLRMKKFGLDFREFRKKM